MTRRSLLKRIAAAVMIPVAARLVPQSVAAVRVPEPNGWRNQMEPYSVEGNAGIYIDAYFTIMCQQLRSGIIEMA